MKRLLLLVAFFATLQASAQQVNPVPDYVFRNQMSVGRNAVTDTAAYFSIGPRYGATKGFMPPIVVDTAIFSSGKRNGLLIFSVQKNKFLYWDSVRVQWSDMAGSSGSYITGTLTSNYLPKATGSTTIGNSQIFDNGTNIGIGTTTPNGKLHLRGVTDIYMNIENTTSNNNLFLSNVNGEGRLIISGFNPLSFYANGIEQFRVNANGNFGIGTNAPTDRLHVSGRARFTTIDSTTSPINVLTSNVDGVVRKTSLSAIANAGIDTLTISTRAWRQKGLDSLAALEVSGSGTTNYVPKFTAGSTIGNSQIFDNGTNVGIGTASPGAKLLVNTSGSEHVALGSLSSIPTGRTMILQTSTTGGTIETYQSTTASYLNTYINPNGGELNVATTTDAGDYKLQVSGNIYNTGSAVLAATSGNVGVGVTPSAWGLGKAVEVKSEGNSIWSYDVENMFVTSNAYFNGGWKYGKNGKATTYTQFQGQHFWDIAGTGTSGNAITFTTAMTLNATAELLVNTTSDAGDYKLQVSGNIYNTGSAVLAATSGNVGVGTTPSTWTGFGAPVIEMPSGGTVIGQGSVTLGSNFYYVAPNLVYKSTGVPASYLIQVGGSFRFYNAPSGTAGNAITFTQAMTFNDASELLINTTTDAGDYKLQVSGNIYNTGSITTGAPSGGSIKPWKIGEAATVSPTSPNRTIRVEIDGVVYYLHAKTTND